MNKSQITPEALLLVCFSQSARNQSRYLYESHGLGKFESCLKAYLIETLDEIELNNEASRVLDGWSYAAIEALADHGNYGSLREIKEQDERYIKNKFKSIEHFARKGETEWLYHDKIKWKYPGRLELVKKMSFNHNLSSSEYREIKEQNYEDYLIFFMNRKGLRVDEFELKKKIKTLKQEAQAYSYELKLEDIIESHLSQINRGNELEPIKKEMVAFLDGERGSLNLTYFFLNPKPLSKSKQEEIHQISKHYKRWVLLEKVAKHIKNRMFELGLSKYKHYPFVPLKEVKDFLAQNVGSIGKDTFVNKFRYQNIIEKPELHLNTKEMIAFLKQMYANKFKN